jgi:predicted permease
MIDIIVVKVISINPRLMTRLLDKTASIFNGIYPCGFYNNAFNPPLPITLDKFGIDSKRTSFFIIGAAV